MKNLTEDEDFVYLVNVVANRRRYLLPLLKLQAANKLLQYFSVEEFLAGYRLPTDCVRLVANLISDKIPALTN